MNTKLTDLCFIKKKFLTKEECKYLINYYEKRKEISPELYEPSLDVYDSQVKKATFAVIKVDAHDDEFNFIKKKFTQGIIEYGKHLDSKNLYNNIILSHFQFAHCLRILKYSKGSKIHPHIDHAYTNYGSIVLNLNDEYEGGNFSFFNKQYTPELGAGDLMIFPADIFWSHEVTEITKGVRYSVNSFIKNMPEEVFRMIRKNAEELTFDYLNKHKDRALGPLLPQRFIL